MSNLRKCHDCNKTINTSSDNYYMEGHENSNKRNKVYYCEACGKKLQDYPRIALSYFGVVFCVHGGKGSIIKSIDTKGIKIINVDFPENKETVLKSPRETLNSVIWGDTDPDERKAIECEFLAAFQ